MMAKCVLWTLPL